MSAALAVASRLSRTLRVLAGCGVALLGACQSINGSSPAAAPDRALELSIPADLLAIGASLVVDPIAPNWRIEQHDLGNGRYAIAMIKRRFTTGGDGESPQIFRRRVDQIAREQGFSTYQVLEFSEGIESNMPIAQRVSRGVVQFAR